MSSLSCLVGDETGLLKHVFFPNVRAKPMGWSSKPVVKKRKIDDDDKNAPTTMKIGDDSDNEDDEEKRKKALIEQKKAIKPQVTRINVGATQERASGIDAMCFLRPFQSSTSICLATHKGVVQEWDYSKKALVYETKQQHFNLPLEGKKDEKKPRVERTVGVCEVGTSATQSDGKLCRKIASCTNRGSMRITSLPSKDNKESLFSVGHPVHKMRPCPAANHVVALGGKDLDLRLYDLNEQKQSWKAKNVPHDWLNMAVPIWVNDIQFASSSSSGNTPADGGHTIFVGTGYSEVRLYDTRASNQPVSNYFIASPTGDKPPFMSLCPSNEGKCVFAGDTQGRVVKIDMGSGKVVSTFKGFSGSVRGLALDPTETLLVSVSLDRYLRVHDVLSRKQLMRVYLKQRLSTLLLQNE